MWSRVLLRVLGPLRTPGPRTPYALPPKMSVVLLVVNRHHFMPDCFRPSVFRGSKRVHSTLRVKKAPSTPQGVFGGPKTTPVVSQTFTHTNRPAPPPNSSFPELRVKGTSSSSFPDRDPSEREQRRPSTHLPTYLSYWDVTSDTSLVSTYLPLYVCRVVSDPWGCGCTRRVNRSFRL